MADITPGPWTYDPKSGWISADKCCHRHPMHVADIRGWGHLTGKGQAHGMDWDDAILADDKQINQLHAQWI